ncbi:B12-binding domain-containing radical SAM protein [Anaerocolumna sp. MB42-C2]|uniref:B12-binding domain-containing radical SAM protein n=1 Tax=Anaerocolumna sp. MB42-C2 TaxID=3070997 RepID=UPI0027E1130A|nr:radical SAM protein [Anaerocolumna sp. MB42-C2]WMJ87606.1 radical SAM protein [Anaerocolumna sp. MB42-C2]
MCESILLIQPFRKPSIREIIVKNYPCWEIINSNSLVMASVLEKAGMKVDFLNMQNLFKSYESVQEDSLKGLLSEYEPDIVIFHTDYYISFTSTAVFYSIKMITSYYKAKSHNTKIILVGRNGLALGKKVFDIDPNIDVVIKGECEDFIVSLIDSIKNNCLKNISAIIYKENGKIVENPGIGRILDFDKLPVPAFHLLKNVLELAERFTGLKMRFVPVSIRTSFGCPMNCRYCGGVSTWNEYHMKSKKSLENEIRYFKEVFGNKGKIMFFADELFAYNMDHVNDVADIFMKNSIKIDGLFAHSHIFNEELARKVQKISDFVVFGAENCCDEVLANANKKQTYESLLKAIDIAKKNNLKVSLEWVVGLPGENIKTAAKNINAVYQMIATGQVDNINSYVFCPYPNTEFAVNKEKFGLVIYDSFDEMVEEGYPTYSLTNLTSNQIFIYYLLTQVMIKEALLDREQFQGHFIPQECNLERFEELLEKVGGK